MAANNDTKKKKKKKKDEKAADKATALGTVSGEMEMVVLHGDAGMS